MQIQEILIIKNASESYGISTEEINHISRVPSLMELPLRPKGTRGLCCVGGSIVTMVDINLLLDMSEVDLEANESRLLSLNGAYSSNVLLVSEVYNTVNIDKKNIEYLDKNDDPVIAIYKYKDSLVQVLSLDILFSKINRVQIESKEIYTGKVKELEMQEEDSNRFLIFTMADEKFALSIEYLREIILSDVNYTNIAGSSEELLGLITLRDDLVAVIDLRSYYGFKPDMNDKNRILIASHNADVIGLLVDEIIDIKSFLAKDIEYMKESFEDNKISGVIHDDDSLISFFDKDVLEAIFKNNEAYIESKSETSVSEESVQSAMEVIVFRLANREYAFDVECVAEIIDIVDSTEVAFSDVSVDGIINIRGQIVPIVSLFEKLNIPTKINEDSKIIVCNIDGSKIGFVVDSISDILDIKADELKEQNDELFTNILHLDNGKRLILSMDIEKVVTSEDN
ncbi:MAG: chemotaxis protein CheW [Sulfurimonas sp.]|nr:chemotaxis protein CheW [Sulfurimonas sp.]